MVNVLIIGGTRGLGAALANSYAKTEDNIVFGTTRSARFPTDPDFNEHICWVPNIDLLEAGIGVRLVNQLGQFGVGSKNVKTPVTGFDIVIVSAGYFAKEDFVEGPDWDEELKTYTACAIAPPTIVHALSKAQLLHRGCKIILVSSEAGSLALRHPTEGGGNYAHHASKAALNMVGRLLAMDLKDSGVIVSIVHPGFMKTDMTKNVGFDKFYESGNAVEPETAAKSLVEWIDALDASKSGEFWAPRGADDIGTASEILGKRLPTPLQLPW